MSAPDSAHPISHAAVPRPLWRSRPSHTSAPWRVALADLTPPVVLAAGLVMMVTAGMFAGKLVAVTLSSLMFVDTTSSARLLGSVSFLAIVPIAATIAVLHRALRILPGSERVTRHVAVFVLALGYLHLVFWLSRVMAAAMASTGSPSAFMPNMFWWG